MSTIVAEEISQFSRHAEDWWNPQGKFKPLHRLNPVRLGYIRDQACALFGCKTDMLRCLKGLSVLDVGCGGGLLAEPLAKMGAQVTALDASPETIAIARKHAKVSNVEIDYRIGGVEDLAKKKIRYDIITALEVAEHVADLGSFTESLAELLKPGGLLIMSTLNRTPKGFLLGIVAAEYVLGWVPRGTHQWNKFVRPSELVQKLENLDIDVTDLTGLIFNPLRGAFCLSKNDLDVNYLLAANKPR